MPSLLETILGITPPPDGAAAQMPAQSPLVGLIMGNDPQSQIAAAQGGQLGRDAGAAAAQYLRDVVTGKVAANGLANINDIFARTKSPDPAERRHAIVDLAGTFAFAAPAMQNRMMTQWFHGTSSPKFRAFNTPEVYLTNDKSQAIKYASGAHLGGFGQTEPRVLDITASPGRVKNIDNSLFYAMENGDDLVQTIEKQIAKARKSGARYIEYSHPNAGADGEHLVRVSLFPNEDLKMPPLGRFGQ